MTTSVSDNTSNIASLTTSVSDNTSNIASLTTSVSDNTSNISSLNTSVSNNTSNIVTINSQLSELQYSVGYITSETQLTFPLSNNLWIVNISSTTNVYLPQVVDSSYIGKKCFSKIFLIKQPIFILLVAILKIIIQQMYYILLINMKHQIIINYVKENMWKLL